MILLTGGSGVLGREIKRLMPEVAAPTRDEFNIMNPKIVYGVDLIVHCAAYTNVDRAELNRHDCYDLNVIGTQKLSRLGIPMMYISTDSVFDGKTGNYHEWDIPNPVNFYSLTKLLGEHQMEDFSVIVRTAFRQSPWKYEYASNDRFSSADYVENIAPQIVKAIRIFDQLPKVINIAGKRRTHYDLAKITKPDVLPIDKEVFSVPRAMDTSLDCSLWESF